MVWVTNYIEWSGFEGNIPPSLQICILLFHCFEKKNNHTYCVVIHIPVYLQTKWWKGSSSIYYTVPQGPLLLTWINLVIYPYRHAKYSPFQSTRACDSFLCNPLIMKYATCISSLITFLSRVSSSGPFCQNKLDIPFCYQCDNYAQAFQICNRM